MQERSKQHIRGLVLLLPLIVAIIVVIMVARPVDRYSDPKYSPDGEYIEATDSVRFAAFDPNTADYRSLVEAGVPRDVAVSIIRWREAGKVYRVKEDLALCYNMTDSLYFLLES